MENKYYLKKAKLIKLNGILFYELEYNNGLHNEIIFIEFKENLTISNKL